MFNKKFIEINRTFDFKVFDVIPNNTKRKWMSKTDGNAYRCIPLNVANQYGWSVLSPGIIEAEWNGGDKPHDIMVSVRDVEHDIVIASTNFGHGILSILPDFVIRTSRNTSIYVRGIANSLATGLQPLDGIVETDWLPFTFTFNYKFLKPGKLTIDKGQPLFMFFPIERGYIESFDTREVNIKDNKEMYEDFIKYENLRDEQNRVGFNNAKDSATYGKGSLLGKSFDISNHQKNIDLKGFG